MVEVGMQVGTVAHALMVPTLEIPVLIEYDLQRFCTEMVNHSPASQYVQHLFQNEFPSVFYFQQLTMNLPFPLLY